MARLSYVRPHCFFKICGGKAEPDSRSLFIGRTQPHCQYEARKTKQETGSPSDIVERAKSGGGGDGQERTYWLFQLDGPINITSLPQLLARDRATFCYKHLQHNTISHCTTLRIQRSTWPPYNPDASWRTCCRHCTHPTIRSGPYCPPAWRCLASTTHE